MHADGVDLAQFLQSLSDESATPDPSGLSALSDLHGDGLTRFFAVFGGLSLERRRWLLRSLLEMAESSFEVAFGPIFRRCLADPDEALRALAVDGLWEDTSPSLIAPLMCLVHSDPSPQVRAAAAGALGRFVLAGELGKLDAAAAAHIVDELLRAWRRPRESDQVRRRALESMSYADRPEVADALTSAFYGENESLRLGAILGMGRSCDAGWVRLLIGELTNSTPAVRYEAALACGEQASLKAVPALGRLLRDSDWQVCHAAIWALGQIGGPQARELLLDAYDTADEDREAALDEALAEQAVAGGLDADAMEPDDA